MEITENGGSLMKGKLVLIMSMVLMATSLIFTNLSAASYLYGLPANNIKYCKAGKAKDIINKTTLVLTKAYSSQSKYCYWSSNSLTNNTIYLIKLKASNPSRTYTEYGLTFGGVYYYLWWRLQ
jgi:hypothetical protein